MSEQNSESFEANEIKNQILREGIWQPYTERIKNLLKSQEKLWEIYEADGNFENKRKVIEDIINLQPIIADWYNTSKKIIELEIGTGVCN